MKGQYHIEHIYLDREGSLDVSLDGPSYLVFFYKSISLGHLFLDSNQVAKNTLIDWVVAAVKPSIKYYQSRLGIQAIAELNDLESVRTTCEQIADVLNPEILPSTCDVSVVICTRNRAGILRNCLLALRSQLCHPAEIVVVDNASKNNETRRVCREFDVRYVREDRPGLDIARNTGARTARSEVIAYTDDDTVPDPQWVYRIWETFQKYPEAVAMTGLILAGSLKTEAEVIFEKFWPFNRGFTPKIYGDDFFKSTLTKGTPVWEIGAGANMAFKKSVFDDVGFFDERLDVGAAGCSGDSELWYRILADGFSIVYNPLAMVQHFHRDSLEGLKHQLYHYMRGFTVAILIQYQRYGHQGNLKHLFGVIPMYYLSLLRKGFPRYSFQYQTLFAEIRGIFSGMLYYIRHRNTDSRIYIGP